MLPTKAASQWISGASPSDFIRGPQLTSSVQGLRIHSPTPAKDSLSPAVRVTSETQANPAASLRPPRPGRPCQGPRSQPARSGAILCLPAGPCCPGPVLSASGSIPPLLCPIGLTTRWRRFMPPRYLERLSTALPRPLLSKPLSPPLLLSHPHLSLPQPLPSTTRCSHAGDEAGQRGCRAWPISCLLGGPCPHSCARASSGLSVLLCTFPPTSGPLLTLSPRPSPLHAW